VGNVWHAFQDSCYIDRERTTLEVGLAGRFWSHVSTILFRASILSKCCDVTIPPNQPAPPLTRAAPHCPLSLDTSACMKRYATPQPREMGAKQLLQRCPSSGCDRDTTTHFILDIFAFSYAILHLYLSSSWLPPHDPTSFGAFVITHPGHPCCILRRPSSPP
jgi:hypothetical protein